MNENSNSDPNEFAALIGLDWGDREHAVAWLDHGAAQVQSFSLAHGPETVFKWLAELEKRYQGQPVAIALETSKGALINMLVSVPWLTIFPVHPATSARIRRAFTPSGAKDDAPDARVLLDILVHHRAKLHPLLVQDPATRRLAALCELRRKSVDQRTKLCSQLCSTLKDFFPQALELIGMELYSPMSLEFLKRWPDLLALKSCRESTVKAFYYQQNVRSPEAVEKRLQIIRNAVALTTDEVVVGVASRQVLRLVQMVRQLQKHIHADEELIRKAFVEHPDAELFRELPGAGSVLGPRLLVAFGSDRARFLQAEDIQRYSGVAPVKEKSGGRTWIHWRWNAPWFTRQTFVEWACQTVRYCPWSRAYYEQQKRRGKNHWAIMRALAFIWIRILHSCWKNRTPYQPSRYLEALKKHNSPLLKSIELFPKLA